MENERQRDSRNKFKIPSRQQLGKNVRQKHHTRYSTHKEQDD